MTSTKANKLISRLDNTDNHVREALQSLGAVQNSLLKIQVEIREIRDEIALEISMILERECIMRPMLDPNRDLKGATPEKLARALLRPLRPRRRANRESETKSEIGDDRPAAPANRIGT